MSGSHVTSKWQSGRDVVGGHQTRAECMMGPIVKLTEPADDGSASTDTVLNCEGPVSRLVSSPLSLTHDFL